MNLLRLLRILGRSLAYAAIAVVVAVLALVLRLQFGPLALPATATTLAERARAVVPVAGVDLGGFELYWGGWGRGIQLRLLDLAASAPDSGLRLHIARTEVDLRLRWLVLGQVLPQAIEVSGVSATVRRESGGAWAVPAWDRGPAAAGEDGGGFFCPLQSHGAIGRLRQVTIRDATVRVDDRFAGVPWELQLPSLQINRDYDGIEGSGLAFLVEGEHSLPLQAALGRGKGGTTLATVKFAHVDSARLARFLPAYSVIDQMDAEIAGSLAGAFDGSGRLQELLARFTAGAGALDLGFLGGRRFGFTGISAEASYDPAGRTLRVSRAEVGVGAAQVELEDAKWQRGPLDRVSGRLHLARLGLETLDALLPAEVFAQNRELASRLEQGGLLGDLTVQGEVTLDANVAPVRLVEARGRISGASRLAGATAGFEAEFGLGAGGRDQRFDARLREVPANVLLVGLEPWTGPATAEVSLSGYARLERTAGRLALLDLDLGLGAGEVRAPEIFDGQLALRSGRLRAVNDPAAPRIILGPVDLQFDGPRVVARVELEGQQRPTIRADATIENMAVADLPRYWSPRLVPRTRALVLRIVKSGLVERADVELLVGPDPMGTPALRLLELDGTGRYRDLEVDPRLAIPSFTGVAGTARFDRNSIRFAVERGAWHGTRLAASEVEIARLEEPQQHLLLRVGLDGTLADYRPLAGFLAPRLQAEVGRAISTSAAPATLAFTGRIPLLKELRFADTELQGTLAFAGATLPFPFIGVELAAAEGRLELGSSGGDLRFAADVPQTNVAALGALRGPAALRIEYGPGLAGTQHLAALLRFPAAELAATGLGLRKAPGEPGELAFELQFMNHALAAMPRLELVAGGLTASATATWNRRTGTVSEIVLQRFRQGESDFSAQAERREDGEWFAECRGGIINLRGIVDQPPDPAAKGRPLPTLVPPVAPLTVEFRPDRVIVRDDLVLLQPALTARYAGGIWQSAALTAGLQDNRSLRASLGEPAAGEQPVAVRTDDGGAFLRLIGVPRRIIGGRLEADATFVQRLAGNRLEGRASLKQFHVREAPAFARVLSVAALTGLVDVFRGEGLKFDAAETHLAYGDSRFTFTQAKMHGTELGLLIDRAEVDLKKDTYSLAGSLWPGYALNAGFRLLPIVRDILTGKEGQGLVGFAVTARGEFGGEVQTTAMPRLGVFTALGQLFERPPAVPSAVPASSPPAPPAKPPGR